MRVAIISDIHANIAALEAVLERPAAAERGSGRTASATWSAMRPSRTRSSIAFVATTRRRSWATTTMASGFDRDECGCAYRDPEEQRLGDLSLRWTQRTVTSDRKEFLRSLQPEIRFEADGKRFRLVHGSPRRMNEYLFEDRPLSSFQRLAATSEADVLIFGHTHKPYTKRVDGVLFVNAGSVGKPKDGDPRACYVVMDTAGRRGRGVSAHSVRHRDRGTAIRESSLPDKFAEDIETGGKPPRRQPPPNSKCP